MKKVLLLWLFSILLIACSSPSPKDKLETIAEVKLPDNYTVLNNSYQKSGQDFFIQYDVRFDKDSTAQMIQQIKASKYYAGEHVQLLYDSVWYEDKDLYKFEARNEAGDRKYNITFNPSSGVLNYVEYSSRMKL